MTMAPSAAASATGGLLGSLDPEQRAAALLPDGPAQIIAPAGSGKTTTMVARLAVLLSRGVDPARICVVTFNRDAALDLSARLARRLGPQVPEATTIDIRTLHALARQVLLDAGEGTNILADRLPLLRAARRRHAAVDASVPLPEASVLDTWLSAWKVERREPPADGLGVLRTYEELLRARGAVDFDDLVVRACELLETDASLRLRWQSRFEHVCVDEFQDVDAAQLRLVRLLAAPQDNLFVVGDDDQTIYAWRLADVRRILRFDHDYPDAHRVILATNYRCPPPVVEASARLVAVNRERFPKRIAPAPGRGSHPSSIVALATGFAGWPDALAGLTTVPAIPRPICFLGRTRAELGPMLLALVRRGVPHGTVIRSTLDAEPVTTLVDDLRRADPGGSPFDALLRLRQARGWRRGDPSADVLGDEDHAAIDAALGWAAAFPASGPFLSALDAARARMSALRDPSAPVQLVTVHAAKGLEWPTVVIVGFEEERFPNRRAVTQASERERAVEEERRLAYVAVTRATERLILAFDPSRPSPFIAEMGFAHR